MQMKESITILKSPLLWTDLEGVIKQTVSFKAGEWDHSPVLSLPYPKSSTQHLRSYMYVHCNYSYSTSDISPECTCKLQLTR